MELIHHMTFVFLLLLYAPNRISSITDGIEIDIRQYPFMAAMVESPGDCICAGTILNAVWILGAAHCYVQDNKEPVSNQYSFIIGSTYCYNITEDYQKIPIIQAVLHPEYESQKSEGTSFAFNDLALFLLETRIQFHNGLVAATNLSIPNGGTFKDHQKCRALGWGAVRNEGKSSRHLMGVDLWEFPVQMCHRLLHPSVDGDFSQLHRIDFDTDSAICAMYPSGEKGICRGDDGGPLICEGVQVGVASLSWELCATRGAPGVWMKVDRYYRWITETARYNTKIKGNGCSRNIVDFVEMVVLGHFLYFL